MAFGDDSLSERPPPADNVVGLKGVLELKRWQKKECRHDHLEIDETNRRVTCTDCNREVDPFVALCHLAEDTSEWQRKWAAMRTDYKNLASYVPHLRAVRELESMWRGKRLPMCPHCKKGVTAEGLNRLGWVHQSYAAAVEEHTRETAPAADVISLGTLRDDDA